MKRIILLSLFLISLIACNTREEQLEGYLYFKLIAIKLDDSSFIEQLIDSVRQNTANTNDQALVNYYDTLKREGLLNVPSICLKNKSDIKRIYVSQQVHDTLKGFKLHTLEDHNQKVHLKMIVTNPEENIYYSDSITELKVVTGKTYWKK